jgi:hypothetical protein
MLSTFAFVAGRIVDDMEPNHALRMCATCREASRLISPRKAAAIAFEFTRKGNAMPATVGTWLRVWETCAEAIEAHGDEASAWAYSWHAFVAPPILQSGCQDAEKLRLFGVDEVTLPGKTMGNLLGFMESLVSREVQGTQRLTAVSILAMRLIIFPEEFQDSDDHGCGFQSSSMLLLSNGQFAIIRIVYAPHVARSFRLPDVASSCIVTDSVPDLNIWTVDTAGRLLMTLPPTGDESTIPGDLQNVLRRMFQLHRTHKTTRLHNGTQRGATRLTRCEEAKPFGSFNRKLAAHLKKNRSKTLQYCSGAKPGQRHQVVDETEDFTYEDLVIQKVRHHDPAAQYHPAEARDIATLQWASFVECSVRERTSLESHASSTVSDEGAQEQLDNTMHERVHLIRFNRRPKELHKQLADSPSLQACREALRIEGFDWKLSSGPSLFVHPWQYVSVVQAVP